MNNELISIIVPVYNVELYLEKCIDSILKQTYENIEILIIDDGSTDNSSKICDNYSKRDARIKVVHKDNGGLSSARNAGIGLMSGKYVAFIDSDDWIQDDYIYQLYKCALENKSDLVITGLKNVYSYDYIEKYFNYESKAISKKEALKYMLHGENGIDVSACGKLYSVSIFKNIKYDIGKLYEDFLIFDKIVESADNISLSRYCGYYYYQRPGSIMHGKYSDDRLILIKKSQEIIDSCAKNYKDILDYAIYRYVVNNILFIKMTINDKIYKKECKCFCNNIKQYAKKLNKMAFVDKKTKFVVNAICFNPLFFKLMWKIKLLIKKIIGVV